MHTMTRNLFYPILYFCAVQSNQLLWQKTHTKQRHTYWRPPPIIAKFYCSYVQFLLFYCFKTISAPQTIFLPTPLGKEKILCNTQWHQSQYFMIFHQAQLPKSNFLWFFSLQLSAWIICTNNFFQIKRYMPQSQLSGQLYLLTGNQREYFLLN